jgi:hypothetical protein
MRIRGEIVLLGCLGAAQLVEAARVLSFTIERAASPLKSVLERRDAGSKSFTEVINNIGAGNGYTANVSVGTPPQLLTLGIDTGSTDTWVLSNTANICLNKTLIAEGVTCAHGTFNPNKSSTIATAVAGGFSATYLDKTGSTGDYITDVLTIAGNTLKGMQMGLAFNSTDSQGTLGLGYGTSPLTSQCVSLLDIQKLTKSRYTRRSYNQVPLIHRSTSPSRHYQHESIQSLPERPLLLDRQSPLWRHRHRKIHRHSSKPPFDSLHPQRHHTLLRGGFDSRLRRLIRHNPNLQPHLPRLGWLHSSRNWSGYGLWISFHIPTHCGCPINI